MLEGTIRRFAIAAATVVVTVVSAVVTSPTSSGATIPAPRFAQHDIRIDGALKPTIGLFNRDGQSDIFWWAYQGGLSSIWLGVKGQRGNFTKSQFRAPTGSGYQVIAGDFAGDAETDLLFWGLGSAPDYLYVSSGTPPRFKIVPMTINAGNDYTPVVLRDDTHKDDLVWYGHGLRGDSVWHFNDNEDGGYTQPTKIWINADNAILVPGWFDSSHTQSLLGYDPGPAPDWVWHTTPDGRFTQKAVTISGAYTPTAYLRPSGLGGIYWSGLGPTADQMWRANASGAFYKTPTADLNEADVDDPRRPTPMSALPLGLGHLLLYNYRVVTQDLVDNGTADNMVDVFKDPNRDFRPPYLPFGNTESDFDGDGRPDLVWYAPGSQPDYVWFGETWATPARHRPSGLVKTRS